MPVTQEECDEDGWFSDNLAERCLFCDSYFTSWWSSFSLTGLGVQGVCEVDLLVEDGFGDGTRDILYNTFESLLQNYKDLFDMNLQTAINSPPTLQDTALRILPGQNVSSDFHDEELYLRRTRGEYTLESNETEYADRKRKCNALKCGEDCNNDSDCYWRIPFDILDSGSFSHCSCEPNIFIDNDSFLGKESLQKKLAENFYDVYAEELQGICRPRDTSESRGPLDNLERDEHRENIFCQDLENTTRISEAIFSSPSALVPRIVETPFGLMHSNSVVPFFQFVITVFVSIFFILVKGQLQILLLVCFFQNVRLTL